MSNRSSSGGYEATPSSPLRDPRLIAVTKAVPGAPAAPYAAAGTDPLPNLSGKIERDLWPDDGQPTPDGARSPDSAAGKLSQYREQMARDMERHGLGMRAAQLARGTISRISPIQEESNTSPTPGYSGPPTTSTLTSAASGESGESGNTVRAGAAPALTDRTPSYPFPRMNNSGNIFGGMRIQDRVLSGSSTPTSAMTFMPAGATYPGDHPDFPTPNLYELALMLGAEPGLDAWWNTVVQIMTECYSAERVTLAVPADSTDIQNVPWGQRATYNARLEDSLSLGYMARGDSLIQSNASTTPVSAQMAGESAKLRAPLRPTFNRGHSFTSFEDEKRKDRSNVGLTLPERPGIFPRSQSYYPLRKLDDLAGFDPYHGELNKEALEEHNAVEEEQRHPPSWEAPLMPRDHQGRVLPVLQALNYEADPLLDNNGVTRVLERGCVIALTRSYPYLDDSAEKTGELKPPHRPQSPEGARKRGKRTRSDSAPKLGTFLGGAGAMRAGTSRPGKVPLGDRKKGPALPSRFDDDDDMPRPPTPNYEEYEQAPPSPWSQSPAPSPAVRADPKENPFFTDAMVDEESFNPSPSPQDYTALQSPEAIGVDNSWTVLHIPLTHILLSKRTPGFKLNMAAMEQKSARKSKDHKPSGIPASQPSPEPTAKERPTPIAILSILSPVIPYPSHLRHSLEQLAPHLATSYSLSRHYSNLEGELAGLQRRRPHTSGFGGVDADGRPLTDPASLANLYPTPEIPGQGSVTGSITSPSDYSAPSRSAAGSAGGTPGWEPGSFGLIADKRPSASSPAPVSSEGYFSTKPKTSRPAVAKSDGASSAAQQKARRNSKEGGVPEKRTSLRISGGRSHLEEAGILSPDTIAQEESALQAAAIIAGDATSTPTPRRPVPSDQPSDRRDDTAAESKPTAQAAPGAGHRHTVLHSYGADFSATFQSLTPSSSVGTKLGSAPPSRSGSMSQVEMPPPSDRLKGLMLDALPAHVFVALPPNGNIVWVNSRYLTYRGQTAADLAADPWSSIHPDDRSDYLRAWSHSVRTGDQFSRTVRIRRFDGAYRWFYARAVASRDRRNVIMQYLGSYMDIHDQHIAELKAARQEEIEASEAKHRLLANLIPQIIFTATEDEGITFANEQWLSYTGQSFEDSLGLGFMDFVHPDDLARCRIPTEATPLHAPQPWRVEGGTPAESAPTTRSRVVTPAAGDLAKLSDANIRGVHHALSRNNSSSSDSVYEVPTANLSELARKGVIKVGTDSSGRLSYTTEIRLRSKTGEYRWHLIRCVEIDNIDFGNGASSYFGSATDINDHKLLEAKLKEAMESKSRFLSNMSHEIRTPLIGISGMVSFLQDTTLNEEQRDYTNTIQTSANSLLMIINDILDLSKVDAGMMKLNFEWFHTRSLIEDVNELVSTMAIAKRLELNYVVEEDVPAWVKGDRVRIRQVLLNVIGNAIKFTNEGEVFSRCKVKYSGPLECDEHQIVLEFAIIDTGRGFTKEEADLIFKPFSQIDGSSTRQHGGSGLGLVISRQLVELHGGQMDGTAVPGKGATFTFTAKFNLPSEEDHPHVASSPRNTGPESAEHEEISPGALKPMALTHVPPGGQPASSNPPNAESMSPPPASSDSSNPSLRSLGSRVTERSSISSVNVGLVHFSQAARASGQDLSQMKFEMPSSRTSPGTDPTHPSGMSGDASEFRPPMYSILVICPQVLSREATVKHIEMTLPKDVPRQITQMATVDEGRKLIYGDDSVIFTHIVLNLPTPEQIIQAIEEINNTVMVSRATVLILSDSVQRQALMKLAAGTPSEDLISESRVIYIYKPVKPSRFAAIFDPSKRSDGSIDRNRFSAQQLVEQQKESIVEVEKRLGNKGYRVLLVEDNPVNQKVLQKYLKKVGLVVEIASDGVECTDKVLRSRQGYYSLILCDLHMPRKDGYQACREIRAWEKQSNLKKTPIIALSANVMSDVHEKCIEAGFDDYVTKPADFIDLSNALSKFF